MKNVVLLTVDTLRKDIVGCYGGGKLTPFIDSIQGQCIRFENASSVGPYTQAGFPGILSSSYYLDFGYTKGKCPKQRVLVSEVLKEKNISTAAFHSNAYLSSFFGWNRGWDFFYDSMEARVSEKTPYIGASAINRKVETWLSNRIKSKEAKPFFLWVHYMDAHEPYVPEQRYVKEVDSELIITENEMLDMFKNIVLKRDITNKEKVEILKKLYSAHVIEVDIAIRELFGIIKENGYHDETIVIITSDHGEEFGEHGGLSHDGKMYQELVSIPLLIYNPELTKPIVEQSIVSNLDVPPTITHLFGVESPASWQGSSLLPIENYKSCGAYGEAIDKFGPREKGDEKEIHFYREGDLKIIYREKDDTWQLFNLAEDLEERFNVIGQNTTTDEYLMKKIIPRIRKYEKKQI